MPIYLTRKTSHMDIHIEEFRKTILVQEKWKYTWLNDPGTAPWTYTSKKAFHDKADQLIWGYWGGKKKLKVRGTSKFAKDHATSGWTVNFDIKWVTANEHWKVNVTRIASTFRQSNMNWGTRVINLDTLDVFLSPKTDTNVFPYKKYYQYPVVHEFGHTAGNSIYATAGMHGDEYKNTSAHLADRWSVMNYGNQIRSRHLDYVISQLNQMIPNTTFYI